ncbi:hypothetical protein NJ7G_1266 [Natrinema sp. J7-2]|nr:hypothetical protein NJ7G_1266 [Natrinema sp. J7-2]
MLAESGASGVGADTDQSCEPPAIGHCDGPSSATNRRYLGIVSRTGHT